MENPHDLFCMFTQNAWKWNHLTFNGEHTTTYTAQFLTEYNVTVTAEVSDSKNGMRFNGSLGVLWLEASYECEEPYSFRDLENMQAGIILAEENLLKLGIPFEEGYEFHGDSIQEKKEMNKKNREKLKIEELEERLNKEREKQ